jgi:hypothetical protein
MNWRSAVPLGTALILALAACASPDRPSVQPETVALPTPLNSPTSAMAGTISELQQAVANVPTRLVPPVAPFRPSEPESLLQVPRTVLRADLADTGDGHVLIYGAVDEAEAAELAEDLAAYLGSGFGQTNWPVDTQFSVATVGDTVVFTWRSRRTSSDPDRAVAVFEAMASVGQPVPVLK